MTADEIATKTFATGLRGYRQEEVQEFLYAVANEVRALHAERDRLASGPSAVDVVAALAAAEKAAERRRQEAEADARDLLAAAEAKAEALLAAARQEAEAQLAAARALAARELAKAERGVAELTQAAEGLGADVARLAALREDALRAVLASGALAERVYDAAAALREAALAAEGAAAEASQMRLEALGLRDQVAARLDRIPSVLKRSTVLAEPATADVAADAAAETETSPPPSAAPA